MGKTVTISPIKKEYEPSFRTQESSLAVHEFVRTPGTKLILTPKREADGRYRTGLDKTAPWLKNLQKKSPEAYEYEINFIDEALVKLKEVYPETDFGNRSIVWQAYNDKTDIKVSPIALGNGSVILSLDNIQNFLDYVWIRVHPAISKSLESFNRGECIDCQYYIANEEAENKLLYSKNKIINKAIADFDSLTPTKAKQISRLMGLPITDSVSSEAVYNQMDALLKKPSFGKGSEYEGRSTINVFNELLELSDDILYIKDLIERSTKLNIYRVGPGGKVMEGNLVIAEDKNSLVKLLMSPDRQKELLALETRVKHKQALAGVDDTN